MTTRATGTFEKAPLVGVFLWVLPGYGTAWLSSGVPTLTIVHASFARLLPELTGHAIDQCRGLGTACVAESWTNQQIADVALMRRLMLTTEQTPVCKCFKLHLPLALGIG